MKKGYKRPPRTKEWCKKISLAKLGSSVSEETKQKMSKLMSGKNNPFYGKTHTPEVIARIVTATKSRTGELNHRWVKDRTLLKDDSKERGGQLHREWSKTVKNRDKWICRIADNKCNGKVVAHHILPWSKFPELRYEVNNGITLCHFHHPRKRNDEMILSPFFQELVKNA